MATAHSILIYFWNSTVNLQTLSLPFRETSFIINQYFQMLITKYSNSENAQKFRGNSF